MNPLKNKKAAGFALVITIAVFLLCGYAIFKFMTSKTGVAEIFASPAALMEANYEISKFEFFAEESSKLAVLTAYQKIASEGRFAGEECSFNSEGMINFCSLAPDLNEQFSIIAAENFNRLISSYENEKFSNASFNAETNNGIIKFAALPITIEGNSKGQFSYSFATEFKPEFSVSLDTLGLDSFQEIYAKSLECAEKENEEECMNPLSGFDAKTSRILEVTYFNLESRQKYFAGKNYANIGVNFWI